MISGRRDVLVVRNKEPGFVYRVVNANDAADMQRIEDLKEIGYEFVSNPTTADPTANTAGSVGTSSKIATGGGTFGYVMRIRKEYYDEDQAAKQREVRATELATMDKATHKEVDFGSVAITNR
jgi:hypothetical protein